MKLPVAITKLFENVWNKGELDVLDSILMEDFFVIPNRAVDLNALKKIVLNNREAFPDMRIEVIDSVTEGNKIAINWRLVGTHSNTFLGVPATGEKIKYHGNSIFYLEGEKIQKASVFTDKDMMHLKLKLNYFRSQQSASDFKEDFNGPAKKIFREYLRVRPVLAYKQFIINALRFDFTTMLLEDPPKVIVPDELLNEVDVNEMHCPRSNHRQQIRCLLYKPKSANKNSPVVVYAHGGAFCMGSPENCDLIARNIAWQNEVYVLNVDYRLAPEHPYPAGLNDFLDVYHFARHQHKKVVLAGDSAGANLVAAATIKLRDANEQPPDANIMLCPVTDLHFENYASYLRLAPNGLVYDAGIMGYARSVYAVDPKQWDDIYVSPIVADLEHFPASLLVAAGVDPMWDDNNAFYNKLMAAGNKNIVFRPYKDMPHAFYYYLGLTTDEKDCYLAIQKFLQQQLFLI